MQHVWGKQKHTDFFVTEPAGSYSLENFGVDGTIIFKWILNKQSEKGGGDRGYGKWQGTVQNCSAD